MKLTKEMKLAIVRETIKVVFADRRTELIAREDKLAYTSYCALYPLDVRMAMNKLPDNFFSQSSVVYIIFPESNENKRKDRNPIYMLSSKKISAEDKFGYEKPVLKFTENVPLSDDIRKLIADKNKLEDDSHALKSKINILLAGINTKKQLETEWPDGKVYYEEILPAPKILTLPAVRGAEITEIINKIK